MHHQIVIVTALLAGCAGDSTTLSSTASLIGKCSFGEIDYMRIEPGEIFLYATFDPADDSYAVITGEAEHAESLTDRDAAQELGPAYAATLSLGSLAFGDEKWIGMGNRTGDVHSTGGETYGTQNVYPSCVFWPDEP